MFNTPMRDASIPREDIRARQGERMWVLLNHIKADKREVFEQFMRGVLVPASQKATPDINRHVRFLEASEPNADGTYTYIFLMDPLLPGVDYGIMPILQQVYPSEQAAEYGQMWDDCMASPQVGYEVIQSQW